MRGGPPRRALARQRQKTDPPTCFSGSRENKISGVRCFFLHRTPGFCVLFYFRPYFTVSVAEVEVTVPMLLVTTQRYWMPLYLVFAVVV